MVPIPKCKKCEIDMILREKNGEKFFGCKNWQTCKSKTQPYYAVDQPKPNQDETLTRMELKLDWIIENLKTPEQRQHDVLNKKEDMESIGQILNENESTPF